MKVQRTIMLILALALVALGAVACGGGNSTPTKAFQTFYNGIKNKDVKSLKSVMPKEMLDAGEQKINPGTRKHARRSRCSSVPFVILRPLRVMDEQGQFHRARKRQRKSTRACFQHLMSFLLRLCQPQFRMF